MKKQTLGKLAIVLGILILVVGIPILSSQNTIFTKIDLKELKQIIKNDEFTFVYIGYADCSFCKQMQPALAKVHETYTDEKIYYLDYSKLTKDEQKELKALDDRLSTMGTPTFLFIEDGEIEGVKVGATETTEEFLEIYKGYYEEPVYYTAVTADEFVKKFNGKGTYALVIGQSFCGACNSYKPIISKVANENNIKIYYLEYDVLSSEDKEKISKLNKKFENFSTPYTLVTKKSKILAEKVGYQEEADLVKLLKENKIIK